MTVVFRAEDEPTATRLDYLRHLVADTIVPFGLRIEAERGFRAQILTGELGAFSFTKVTAPPLEAFRTSRLIRSSDPELLKIDVQVRGRTVFGQDGRQALLNPGDFTLMDLSRPSHVAETSAVHEVVAVKFPRTMLALPPDEVAQLTAVPISGQSGLGAPISSLTSHLVRHLDSYDPAEAARLSAALIDMLVVVLASRLDRTAMVLPGTRGRALLMSVQAFIEQHLGDPGLSPDAIARSHHISVRYLYKLFETQGTTVGEWIRHRRLEHCRRDLLDPGLRDRPAYAIAARWGFFDPAHFTRAFRAAHGHPPAEYRRLHLMPPVPSARTQDADPRPRRSPPPDRGSPGDT
jgi:AraC-like DNA-binding protein